LNGVAPHVVLITETNVPHHENISYFGNGKNEAQMVYNFSLPPLVLHSIQTGDGSKLLKWAKTLQQPTEQITFFNFLASHDGVGLLPAKGILTDGEIDALAEHTLEMGGKVSYKNNPDGTTSPYEMNINYLDATRVAGGDEPVDKVAKRFLASQSIMLALRGVPGIYYHSLFGSQNWVEGIQLTGMNRSINREKLNIDELQAEIDHPESLRFHVFNGFKQMLTVRRNQTAFDPHGEQQVLDRNPAVFGLLRTGRGSAQRILCLTNLSDTPQTITLKRNDLQGEWNKMVDLLDSGSEIQANDTITIELSSYQVSWMLIK
jgi:sucrose phosphorylase